MLRLGDFVLCRKRFYNQSGGLYLSFGRCRKMEFGKYVPSSDTYKQIYLYGHG